LSGRIRVGEASASLELKYHSVSDGAEKLGGVARIRKLFIGFQKYLYEERKVG
jgi:type I restriction enzyme R subunit